MEINCVQHNILVIGRPSGWKMIIDLRAKCVLGVLVPIALLVRTLLLGCLFGSPLKFLLYPGSIFLFDASRHSSLYGMAAFGLSLMATVALYAFAAMILFAIFRGITGHGVLCGDIGSSNQSMKPTAGRCAASLKDGL